jgi:hypothetical protein
MNRFYNTLATLAVILTPAAMMATAGWEAYALTLAKTGIVWLAILTGVATAAALECVGILAGETALLFHGRADRRWRIAAAVLLAYVVAGLYVLRSTPLVFLPVLAGAVYVLVGLRAQAQRETAAEVADDVAEREWQHEQWRIRQQDATAVKLARVQAAPAPVASTLLATTNGASSHASTSIYACKQCKETFPTMQGLGAHVRHSHGKVTHE